MVVVNYLCVLATTTQASKLFTLGFIRQMFKVTRKQAVDEEQQQQIQMQSQRPDSAGSRLSRFSNNSRLNLNLNAKRGVVNPKHQLIKKVKDLCQPKMAGGGRAAMLTREYADILWNEFLTSRYFINFSMKNILQYIFCSWGCKMCQPNPISDEGYQQLLIQSGKRKYESALDVQSIYRTNKYLRIFLESFYSHKSIKLMKNQASGLLKARIDAIDSEGDFTLSDEESDFNMGGNMD